ncbi:SRPBCC family protein [Streptomyces xinghaiensis]|uniref:SRPBCC family protein n=1 Tax=Streptomyces xinghaiensis TaxID=1038928 RepID=UPI0003118A0E|nr:SRPBCC family protein [Streptomyces xinghaiensis]MZE78385.1 SRPBCC family protein [Streptomyces sp. SID5475]
MALFRITRRTPLPADEAWRRVTDWERHADHVPLTRITVAPPLPTRPGTVFTARTGVGRAAFADPMEVVVWEPPGAGRPGRCRMEKRGRVVTGWAGIEVRAHGTGSEVIWSEDLSVTGLPRLLDRPTALAGRLLFGRVIARLLAAG